MNKYKIYIYAISKNEEKFAERWADSMSEADGMYVLDTGSSDGTVDALRKKGVHVVSEIISPWRFDAARNRSLELVPLDADLCVCTDLDEVFCSGWREKFEQALGSGNLRPRYRYTWSFNEDGSEGIVFWMDKTHPRFGYSWVGPVHEVLKWNGDGPEPMSAICAGVQLNHFPDSGKSRGQYLGLLELAVREDPQNDRNMHYLGREYMFYGRWDACIDTLKRHLSLKSATWADERCASMRFIARAYMAKGDLSEAERWYLRAAAEAPHLREPWLEYAKFAYRQQSWDLTVWLCLRALQITERPTTYISDADSFGFMPYDLAALGYYYTGRYKEALEYAEKALSLAGDDARLKENVMLIKQKV